MKDRNVMDTIGDQCKAFYFGWLTEMLNEGYDIRNCVSDMVQDFDLTFRQATQITAAWIEANENDTE